MIFLSIIIGLKTNWTQLDSPHYTQLGSPHGTQLESSQNHLGPKRAAHMGPSKIAHLTHKGPHMGPIHACWLGLKYVGPRGLYLHIKGVLFLLRKSRPFTCKYNYNQGAMSLWFGMVISIDHPHTTNGKYTPYVEGCRPQGQYANIKDLLFLF